MKRARLTLSLFALASLASAVPSAVAGSAPSQRELRVCADPNNLPFSNANEQGFENKLAELVASEMHAKVSYTFAPERRGFLRNTLNANRCDVIMGVPSRLDLVATTRPYYRSAYVIVYGPEAPHVRSLDAPELHRLRIGVPLVGGDGGNPPPVLALASRALLDNMRAYSVYGDYRSDSPPAEIIRALERREIDVALAWGPLAGYFSQQLTPHLAYARLPEKEAPPGSTFAFDISLGVRRTDHALLSELNGVLARRKAGIDALLDAYHVPRF